MRSWPGYGLLYPSGAPTPTPHWGKTRPPIYEAYTAAAADAVIRAQAAQPAVDFTPSAIFPFDDIGASNANAVDTVGGVILASGGAGAARVASDDAAYARAVTQVKASLTGYWAASAKASLNFTTNAFAFAARIRFSSVGGGAWWLSKASNADQGYYAMGHNGDGTVGVAVRATDGTSAGASVAGNLADNAWRWVLFGRSITNAVVWACHTGGAGAAAFAAAKSLDNVANSFFGLWFNLFGTPQGGADCEIAHLLGFSGEPAENVYTHRLTLRTALETVA